MDSGLVEDFVAIPPEDLTDEEMGFVKKSLQFDYGGRSLHQVLEMAADRKLQFWRVTLHSGSHAIIGTQLLTDADEKSILLVYILGGTSGMMPALQDVQRGVFLVAQYLKASRIRAYCRPGAARQWIRHLGYTQKAVCIEMEV